MKRKWLSMLLALALVFSLAPAIALAEVKEIYLDANSGDDSNSGLTEEEAVETFKKALELISDGDTIYVCGTYQATANNELHITKPNITIQGKDSSAKIDTGSYSVAGQAGILVAANNVIIKNLEIISQCSDPNVSAVKYVSVPSPLSGGHVEGLTLSAQNGHALNIHGVSGMTIKNIIIKQAGKCDIALANSPSVTVTGCDFSATTNNNWADIGIMYDAMDEDEYSNPTGLNFGANNKFGITPTIYSERPSIASGGKDTVTATGVSNLAMIESDTGWVVSDLEIMVQNIPTNTTIIKLISDAAISKMLDIQQDGITLDLNGHTITASESFTGGQNYEKHLVNVQGDNVTIKNGTLKTTSDNRHALNLYNAENVNLSGLTLDHTTASAGAPIVVGASTVTVSGKLELITGTASWYGMNIDSNITGTGSSVTFNEGSNLVFGGSSNIGIRIDDEGIIGGALSLTFNENMDISVPNIDNFIVVQHLLPEAGQVKIASNSSLDKDENGNYILAQNPEVTPPTPPISSGGWDDTLWPNILQHPQSVSASAGSLATFSVVANGGPLSYQWQVDRRDGKGFVSIPGATGATLTVGPVTGAENGYQYRCAVTLYGATMYSGAAQLFVTAGMIPKTGDMPGSPVLLLALASLGLAAWAVARRRAR